MTSTPNLNMPYIAASQAQKHVTHNEAIRVLDALVQLSVHSKSQTNPPASPDDGERYIVPASATGAWTGKTNAIAAMQDGAWAFFAPQTGWRDYLEDTGESIVFSGVEWKSPTPSTSQTYSQLGINATPDNTNRFTTASDATLLNHDGAGHQLKINRNASSDTASVILQSGYSGVLNSELSMTRICA